MLNGYISSKKGVPRTEKDKLKISEATKKAMLKLKELGIKVGRPEGGIPWNKGKCYKLPKTKIPTGWRLSEETKEKMRKPKTLQMREKLSRTQKTKPNMCKFGDENSHWEGGKKMAKARAHTKRRELGFVPLNDCEVDGWVGHHLDKEHVLYIPEEIHKSSWHTQKDQESMDAINEIVVKWYDEHCGLGLFRHTMIEEDIKEGVIK